MLETFVQQVPEKILETFVTQLRFRYARKHIGNICSTRARKCCKNLFDEQKKIFFKLVGQKKFRKILFA
jgi:hypothetical protein